MRFLIIFKLYLKQSCRLVLHTVL